MQYISNKISKIGLVEMLILTNLFNILSYQQNILGRYRFYDIKYIAKGGFGKVYKANWIDGRILKWEDQNWERDEPNKFVALKSLNNSKNITSEFLNEV